MPSRWNSCIVVDKEILSINFGFVTWTCYLLQMLSSKDVNFVGYTYKNYEIVNDDHLPGIGLYIFNFMYLQLFCRTYSSHFHNFFPQYKSSSSIYCCYLLVLHDSFALVTFMNLMAYINFISFQSCVWVNFIMCSRIWGVYCYRWKIYWVTILPWTCKLLTLPCVPMDNTLVWL
jgi:hypothetical protein